jgi:PAS domain S-box-containing protein
VHFLSENFIERLHPEDKGRFRSHFELLLNGGNNNYELNYRVKGKTDGWLWFVERGVVIERDKSGKALRLIACIRDVTSIKQEQEQFIRLANELKRRLKLAEAQIQK